MLRLSVLLVSKLPRISENKLVKILVKEFGFEFARQKGDHVILRKFSGTEKIVTVVPLHNELKPGTLLIVLELARVKKRRVY